MSGTNWELYTKLLCEGSATPITNKQAAINTYLEIFLSGMQDDPSYQSDATVNSVVTPMLISRTSALMCKIKAAPNTAVHIGDLVECFGEKWLVEELYVDKMGIVNGVIWICNEIIKFQNNSSTIYTRYCVLDDGTYSKMSGNPDASTLTNTYKLYMSIDTASDRLYVDKRLSTDLIYSDTGAQILEVYKIVGIDKKTKNLGDGSHLMVITLQRDVYNEATDSILTGICDVYVDSGSSGDPGDVGRCEISGSDKLIIGTTRKYTASFYESNSTPSPVWTVTVPVGSGITYATQGSTCTVTAPYSEGIIGALITLKLEDANSEYGYYEKKVRVIAVG